MDLGIRIKDMERRQHIEGIKKYGISEWHRKTYGICKDYS